MLAAINLRYGKGYNLANMGREGIGVYISNLTRALHKVAPTLKICYLVSQEATENARKFILDECLDFVKLISTSEDLLEITPDSLESVTIAMSSGILILEKPILINLNKNYWRNIISQHGEIQIVVNTRARPDSLYATSKTHRLIYLTLSQVCSKKNLVLARTSIETSLLKEDHEISFRLSADIIDEPESQIYLELAYPSEIGYVILSSYDVAIKATNGEKINPKSLFKTDFEIMASNSLIDTVMYHHPLTYSSIINKPCIYHIHDILFFEYGHLFHGVMSDLEMIEVFNLCRNCLRKIKPSSTIVFTSEHVQDNHIRPRYFNLLKSNRVNVVRNCILADMPKLSRRDAAVEPNKPFNSILAKHSPYVTYPTQPRATKQLDLLNRIVERIRVRVPNLKLVLTCTEDSYKRYCPTPPSYIIFLPNLSREELSILYSNAFLTIVTTLYEASLPWQFLESIAAGTPAICFRSAIVDEFVKHGYISSYISARHIFESEDDAVELGLSYWEIFTRDKSLYEKIAHNALDELRSFLPVKSWNDVAHEYFEIIKNCANSADK